MSLVEAIARCPEGGTVEIPAGTHTVNLRITRAITLVGSGEAVLDGRARGPVISVQAPGASVTLKGLVLQHGANASGGGLECSEVGQLLVEKCTLQDNDAASYGGGGLWVSSGQVKVVGCLVQRNKARQGAGILVERVARVVLDDTELALNVAIEGAALRVRDGASVVMRGGAIQDNKVVGDGARGSAVMLTGTPTLRPGVELVDVALAGQIGSPEIWNEGSYPGKVVVRSSPLARTRMLNAVKK